MTTSEEAKFPQEKRKQEVFSQHGVPAQEEAPAKLMVYLQRFRPLDYQRLLEAASSGEATGDSAS